MADVKTCVVDLNQGRMKLDCRVGMTLFAALRTHQLYLPTGCGARGQCGQCHVMLLRGEANPHTDSERKLIPEDDLAAGKRLGCQLRLSGDISVEVPEPVFHARQFKAKIAEIEVLTHDIRRFSFSFEDGVMVDHVAGQFLNLFVRMPEEKAQVVRCFSFATPPSVRNRLDAIIRLNPKGTMTPYLFNRAKVGDEVTIIAPFGQFRLTDTKAPCIWIAGGSGLSPFIGMLEDLKERGVRDRRIHLFFGAVKPEDLYYVDYFRSLTKENLWFKYTLALSGDIQCPECIDYGLITDIVSKRVETAVGHEGYLCGSPGMIGACIKVLTEKGMRREDIFYDRFV